ncbi:NAD-dependent epimerase/dehydratase family protein [Candidatus Parcubacteria bacterium]|nr:NAD-dependent epimerase/dehydratase family protein [Candidatus Parcubacteria bacterium]
MNIRFKKNLILGGGGFIGSHLSEALIKNKNDVVVIDHFSASSKNILPSQVKIYNLDISSPLVKKIFREEKPDFVFNLAGPIHLRRGISDPLFENGFDVIKGFKKILDYSHTFQIKKLIFASSGGAIYESAKILPTSEDYPAHPSSLYGRANLILERLLEEYYKSHKLNFIILRLSNVYGPRQWESGAIPSFINRIKKDKSPIIYSHGQTTRDFIFIEDVIRAFLISAKSKEIGIFNVGSSQEITLNEVIQKISKILGKNIEPKYYPKKNEITRSFLNYAKIKKQLKWKPCIDFDEGLKKTIDWYLY